MTKSNSRKTGSGKSAPYLTKYFIYLVIAGVIGIIIASVKYFGSDKMSRYSSAVIEFTYEGAAKNLSPNGEKFSINAITSDEVLENAIADAGYEGDYTAAALRDSIVVTGSYPADVLERIEGYDSLYDFSTSRQISLSDYYPTIYTITLYDDFDKKASSGTMNSIVNSIARAYKEFFTKEYMYKYAAEDIDQVLILDNYDYLQRLKILKQRLNLIQKYAEEMYNKDISYSYNGDSFSDISVKCRELRNNSLANLEALVTINAMTVSSARLRNQYEYEIKLLENELKYKNENLDELNGLIEVYERDSIVFIGSGDSLVKMESNSSATYEELIDQKRELSQDIVEINAEIGEYKQHLNDLTLAAVSPAQDTDQVEKEIVRIFDLIKDIETDFKNILNAYNASTYTEDDIILSASKHYDAKLLSSGFVVAAIKGAGPLCIIVLILCAIHAVTVEVKRFKRKTA